MKFKYVFILVLITVLGFHFSRNLDLEKYIHIKQKLITQDILPIDGKLIIEKPLKYLILNDKTASTEIDENLFEAFKFAKTKYDIKRISTEEELDTSSYSGIIITTQNYFGMSKINFQKIKKFIADGNFLFICQSSIANPFNPILELENLKNYKNFYGIYSNKEIFPGLSDVKIDNNYMEHYSLDVKTLEGVQILVSSKEKVPLVWEKKYGKGRIIYSNTNIFSRKSARGLLKQLIAYESTIDFSPILNAKVFHLDDFPAPIPKFNNPLISREYGLNTLEFYNRIWLKDIYALGRRNKIIYSGFLIGEYNSETAKENFTPVSGVTSKELSIIGRYNIANGGELGFHGYNHYSLGLDGEIDFAPFHYTPWKDIESMKKALAIAKDLYKNLYGDEFSVYSYVAPSNLLGPTGKRALIEVFNEITNFSGIFFGSGEKGTLIQEVGRDPDYNFIYALPRFTSGYDAGDEERWQTYTALALYGYSSHFVHPDDVLDAERGSGKTWDELRDNFEKYIKEINIKFPYLEAKKQMDLVESYKNIEELKIDTEIVNNNIKINIKRFRAPFYSTLRVGNRKLDNSGGYSKLKIRSITGGIYKYMDETEEFTLYLIKVNSPEIEIKLGE